MKSRQPLVFKFASEDWEFEQIHRLNYKTFVEEITQHQPSPAHRLVDKFHAENTYLICLCGRRLLAMLAVRGARPFSLDQKLENLDSYLPAGRKVCEIRLLAVEKKFRGAQVLQGILALLWQHGIEKGYDLAIISGTTRQFKLYQHLGFVPFGPLVGAAGEAQFQPMFVTLEMFESTAREFLRSSPSRSFQQSAVNFLPGPVTVRREVRRAFEQAPESHRADTFMKDFASARQVLCELVRAGNVQLMVGSGTLANDVVGGQLSLERSRGIVLSNGEFGVRLVDQARRFRLDFTPIDFEWGRPLDLGMVRKALEQARAGWLWCAHCETSTGVLNDLAALKALCAEFDVKLCVDAISSIGTAPVDLTGVFLASCSSGKGLRGYPGLSMVFHHHEVQPQPERLPRYLDLGFYAQQEGVPFTFSSNLLHALHAAIKHVDWNKRFAGLVELSGFLRAELSELGFELVGSQAETSPAVVTIALAPDQSSATIGTLVQEAGYLMSFNSEYLRKKNWVQICLMGECTREKTVSLLNALKRVCVHRPAKVKAAVK
ncbi:MAG TPA: aminotransferase class V-fold PLP-dependent enzyme [Verrucomicrobiae bacterium]|nr:aminotransferase class V-fold PLP-dependent enzyme [Verrucomicrobiae bacterium]